MERFIMDHRDLLFTAPLIREFLSYTETIKGKSSKTAEEYFLDLRTFFRFLKQYYGVIPFSTEFEDIDIKDIDIEFIQRITLDDAYNFFSYCKNERENKENARARKTSTLKSFFKYLPNKKGLLKINPNQELDSPKPKKTLPKYLPLEQSIDLLKSDGGINRERDYAMLTIVLHCVLRVEAV